jgi:hypothetical protein
MKIEVTDEHIFQGQPNNDELCPIALALTEATGVQWKVRYKTAWKSTSDRRHRHLPASAVEFVKAFDAKESVEPFSFEIDAQRELLEQDNSDILRVMQQREELGQA